MSTLIGIFTIPDGYNGATCTGALCWTHEEGFVFVWSGGWFSTEESTIRYLADSLK